METKLASKSHALTNSHLLALCAARAAAPGLVVLIASILRCCHVDLVVIVRLHRVNVHERVHLDFRVISFERGNVQWRWQVGAEALLRLNIQSIREPDRQNEEQIAVDEWVFVRWHALIMTAFTILMPALALGSASTYIVQFFLGFLAAKTSSRVPVLK